MRVYLTGASGFVGSNVARVLAERHAVELRCPSHAEVFELDEELLDFGPPDFGAVPSVPVPYDTSLDGAATAAALDFEPPVVRTLLRRLRDEIDTGRIAT